MPHERNMQQHRALCRRDVLWRQHLCSCPVVLIQRGLDTAGGDRRFFFAEDTHTKKKRNSENPGLLKDATRQ